MSCLDVPRIHFNGKFSTNVCTSNNDDVTAVADEYKPVVDPFNVTLNENLRAKTNEEIAAFFQSLAPQQYKDGTPLQRNMNGGWNHFGDHVIEFRDASVSQVVNKIGAPPVTDSKLLNTSVTLPNSPKMVDVDPTGASNTQLFLGGFQLGDFSNGIYFSDPTGVISFFRWIGGRNNSFGQSFTAAAATWQFGIPNGTALQYFGDDPTLATLKDAAGNGQGLLVQFCIYVMKPHFSADQLAQLYADGNYVQNPAIGEMVGTVGVWGNDELATYPNGRQLVATKHGAGQLIGPAAAAIAPGNEYASLNLITAFPETVVKTPAPKSEGMRAAPTPDAEHLEKIKFGTVNLVCRSSTGKTIPIGVVKGYDDYDAYRACAGIVDVKLDQEALKEIDLNNYDLGLSGEDGLLLEEQPLSIATDQHSAYLSSGTPSQAVTLQVRHRGELFDGTLSAYAQISESSYRWNDYVPSKDAVRMTVHDGDAVIEIPNAEEDNTAQSKKPVQKVEFSVTGGKVHAEITRNTNGETLTFGFSMKDLATGHEGSASVGVRLYLDETFPGTPTWEQVYENVLRYYAVVFPAMNERIDLTNETVVRANADKILVSLDQPFTSPFYMPVTRSMSPDRRQLLQDWLKGVTS